MKALGKTCPLTSRRSIGRNAPTASSLDAGEVSRRSARADGSGTGGSSHLPTPRMDAGAPRARRRPPVWIQARPEPVAVIPAPAGPERAPIPPPPGLLPAVRVPLCARNRLPAFQPPAIAAPQPASAPSSASDQAFMAEVRRLAALLHSATPNLKTKTAGKAATSRGEVISKVMILENDKVQAACKLLGVIPAFALESCLGDRLSAHSPAESVDAVRHRVVRDGGHKSLAEAVTDYSGLLAHMHSLGGEAAERAAQDRVTVGDVNRYLTFRQDRAVTSCAHEVDAFPAPAALPCDGVPTKRKRDGFSAAMSVKKKLKRLADSWSFCIPGDKRVGIPAPAIHGPARQKLNLSLPGASPGSALASERSAIASPNSTNPSDGSAYASDGRRVRPTRFEIRVCASPLGYSIIILKN